MQIFHRMNATGAVSINQQAYSLLTLGGHDRVFPDTAFVLPLAREPAVDVLLGADWLATNRIRLD
jgi:hypothetical protein